jgi:hypothetical protein
MFRHRAGSHPGFGAATAMCSPSPALHSDRIRRRKQHRIRRVRARDYPSVGDRPTYFP